MSDYNVYYLIAGATLVLFTLTVGWAARRADVSIYSKMGLVACLAFVSLASPPYIRYVMGLPVESKMKDLPDTFRVLQTYEEGKLIDAWIIDVAVQKGPPRAVQVDPPSKTRKAFQEAARKLRKGGSVVMHRDGRPEKRKDGSEEHPGDATDGTTSSAGQDSNEDEFHVDKRFIAPLKPEGDNTDSEKSDE